MTSCKRSLALLLALSLPVLTGCGHSQDSSAGPATPAAPPSQAALAAQQAAAQQAGAQQAAGRAAAAQAHSGGASGSNP